MSHTREGLVFKAKLAEQSERYEDMVTFMNEKNERLINYLADDSYKFEKRHQLEQKHTIPKSDDYYDKYTPIKENLGNY